MTDEGRFQIRPVEGERSDHDGFQWGWLVFRDGHPYLRMTAGGTGSCWNLHDPEEDGWADDEMSFGLHVCEMDDLIAALTAFREHEAYRANVERWE